VGELCRFAEVSTHDEEVEAPLPRPFAGGRSLMKAYMIAEVSTDDGTTLLLPRCH